MDKINRQFSADDILKVLKRLSGGIYPSGDASADEVSNENLDVYCDIFYQMYSCLLYTSPSPRDRTRSRMPSSA